MTQLSPAELQRSWIARLQTLADEMELEGFEVEAEHLDFITNSIKAIAELFECGVDRVFNDARFIGNGL